VGNRSINILYTTSFAEKEPEILSSDEHIKNVEITNMEDESNMEFNDQQQQQLSKLIKKNTVMYFQLNREKSKKFNVK